MARDTDTQAGTAQGQRVEPRAVAAEVAAEMLSIGRTKIYELIGRGELASFTIGRRRLIAVEAIDEYVAARMAEVQEEADSWVA